MRVWGCCLIFEVGAEYTGDFSVIYLFTEITLVITPVPSPEVINPAIGTYIPSSQIDQIKLAKSHNITKTIALTIISSDRDMIFHINIYIDYIFRVLNIEIYHIRTLLEGFFFLINLFSSFSADTPCLEYVLK